MTRPSRARKVGPLLAFALLLGVMASPTAEAAAALPSDGCGGEIVYSANKCRFVASGTRVTVRGAVTNPVMITYSLPPLVLPGSAYLKVKVTRRVNGVTRVVTSCTSGWYAAAQCQSTSSKPVPRGTVLTCSVQAIGVGRFDCMNAT